MKSLLLIFFSALLTFQVRADIPEVKIKGGAFWEKRTQVLEKIKDRDILVSVKTEEIEGQKTKSIEMQGVGLVHRSVDLAYKIAKDFNNLEKVSDHIKKIDYNEAKRQLYMHSVAFNYHAKMWMRVDFTENESIKQIRFLIERGVFA
ncbi:MAG: hypothetical protein H6625_12570, partial [Bdellovibrionaceae bacterium]|nr:hypothetical protein [Pseudobdellovibrionaceae bacterium]